MPSDLLLLDEPTNHLDLDAVLWLRTGWRATRARCWSSPMIATSSTAWQTRFFTSTPRTGMRVEAEALHRQLCLVRGAAPPNSQCSRPRSRKQQRDIKHLGIVHYPLPRLRRKAAQAQSRIKALERLGASRRHTWIRRSPLNKPEGEPRQLPVLPT